MQGLDAMALRRRLSDPRDLVRQLGLEDGCKNQAGGVLIRCPWHAETHASCSVTKGPDGTIRVKCHACEESGDALTLIGRVGGLTDFAEVLKAAAELAGATIDHSRERKPPPTPRVDYQKAWSGLAIEDPECWDYLERRGVARTERVRFVLKDSPGLGHRAAAGFRIALPIYDAKGFIVGLQLRSLRDREPDSDRRFLTLGVTSGTFGAPAQLEGAERVVVCEGFVDYLVAAQTFAQSTTAVVGVPGAKATKGVKQLELGAREVVVVFDADAPGKAAAKDLVSALKTRGTTVRSVTPSLGNDVAAHVAAGGDLTALVNSRPAFQAPRIVPAPAAPAHDPEPMTDGNLAMAPVPIDRGKRAYTNGSYLTAVQIVEVDDREVLDGRALEFDEMAGRATLDRRPIEDVDETIVRAEIERRFPGGVTQSGNPKGLKIALADVSAALVQVARTRPYHPVRDYLNGLVWDGTERLDAVPEDLLSARRTPLSSAMVRKFMVSAVARALSPGCKVDTVLVLVGSQGCGKSSFFRILGGAWFVDTAVDIHDKDSFQVLRRAWIYEWAELEVLRRAKDAAAVKGFLSSEIDTYRPPYGRNPIEVPRGCVICGSTNNHEFLTDDTGNRRFWPLTVGEVNLAVLRAQRDQLWAEALAIYRRWDGAAGTEPWVLDQAERDDVLAVHAEHESSDAWDGPVLDWAARQLIGEFTTAEVLEKALDKHRGLWTRGDEMRAAAILKRAGWKLGKKPAGRARRWER